MNYDSFVKVWEETPKSDEVKALVDSRLGSTGYYETLIKSDIPTLEKSGDAVACMDAHGRRVLIIKLPTSNWIVFERYTDGDSNVVVANSACDSLLAGGCLTSEGARVTDHMIGAVPGVGNVGTMITKL